MPQARLGQIVKWFRDLLLENLFFKALGAIPLTGAAMTSYFGIADGLSWAYLIPAVSVTFGGLAIGLVGFFFLRSLTTIKNRIAYNRIEIDHIPGTDGFSFRVYVSNLAPFPIDLRVSESTIWLDGRTTLIPFEPIGAITISPSGMGFWNCGLIAGTSIEERANKVMSGVVKLKAVYGKNGNHSEELLMDKKVIVQFDASGMLVGLSAFDIHQKS